MSFITTLLGCCPKRASPASPLAAFCRRRRLDSPDGRARQSGLRRADAAPPHRHASERSGSLGVTAEVRRLSRNRVQDRRQGASPLPQRHDFSIRGDALQYCSGVGPKLRHRVTLFPPSHQRRTVSPYCSFTAKKSGVALPRPSALRSSVLCLPEHIANSAYNSLRRLPRNHVTAPRHDDLPSTR
jgi:hypothetical protein